MRIRTLWWNLAIRPVLREARVARRRQKLARLMPRLRTSKPRGSWLHRRLLRRASEYRIVSETLDQSLYAARSV